MLINPLIDLFSEFYSAKNPNQSLTSEKSINQSINKSLSVRRFDIDLIFLLCLMNKRTRRRANKSWPMRCAARSSVAWRLPTRPDNEQHEKSKNEKTGRHCAQKVLASKELRGNLLKLLLDVGVRLQLELPARVGPVDQEEPLLCVQLLHQDGRLLVVPRLEESNAQTQAPFKSPPSRIVTE